jgi:hypothetical protein
MNGAAKTRKPSIVLHGVGLQARAFGAMHARRRVKTNAVRVHAQLRILSCTVLNLIVPV